ncbi:hypothetical protein N7366_20245 [Aeromonas caviae]|uniref:hypothetical protein n=1 Tax=Aeromonas caviae TaxID=648 RepID=UPI00244C3E67|nr:hypothetical protein [Aeromonas caviae]MDH0435519.1 hypothetical protein [Aeromonas caviae]MDH0938364.1 hypothetical protein [Aeromonas caviae]MDH1399197.1 hypothetical protein [Aeromonas caviae]MDH1850028.1 hypothetical protein [Aeromonas caviae]
MENYTRRYARIKEIESGIAEQLNGSMDSVRARAWWSANLHDLTEEHGAENVAEAISVALEKVRRQLNKPLVS